MTADTAAPPLLDIHTNIVQGLGLIREQLHEPPEPESSRQDTVSPSLSTIHKRVVHAICSLGFNCNVNMHVFDLQRSLVVTDIRIIMITIAVAISIKIGRILRRGLPGSSDLTSGCRTTCMSVALINYLKLKRLEHQQPVESSWQQALQQHLTCAKWCQLRLMASCTASNASVSLQLNGKVLSRKKMA